MGNDEPIYLDHHATTPLDPAAAAAMRPWWENRVGNPHSADHWFGWQANQAVEVARAQIAELINADASEIVFTSGATEANNLALLGAAEGTPAARRKVLVSAIEHKCVMAASAHLADHGWQVEVIPVDVDGRLRSSVVESMLDSCTALVSVMAVNNEIGTIQDIKRIANLCHEAGAWFHCDAAQAPAAMPIDVLKADIDLLSLSSHKIYGPMGVGALYGRGDILDRLRPISFGGGQERGVRSGTLPTALCVGFGVACKIMHMQRNADAARIAQLRDRLCDGIKSAVPSAKINGPREDRHPGNLNVCFPGVDASIVLGKLQPNLAASTGSACSTGIPEPSHVLTAIGMSLIDAESSIRFGIGRFTTESEIDRAIQLVSAAVASSAKAVA